LTDAGLKEVAKLSNLTSLDISGNVELTDAGLKDICALKKLKSLTLGRCLMTPAGIDAARIALPDCDLP
jgi:hypothetical protein